ncbi:MAG: hypothetical protein A3F54_00060 [Candidatus Kerfeldbacteria bacterium RIFCSPHIGHO2_12_FULL_48_17]|uniref:Nudix hydrolase domain-containing protein n=1 Tax=Candidatus Kerfeldbacteria bacterium RIFCSPHIGHO2_12_FULL_48_17 TaxID=1798542 RepID=A0A1G2B7Q3_9BACT|nr:MAG: hypothetical protein A3F54_00060 [Candidatus Kerfeldbacteria bacterium RIFCSPHIGHO2_12_FULL_48_17]
MPAIPKAYYRTSIKALVLDKNKKFLLCLEDNGKWELPGGGLDFGEKPHDGLRREIKEEMGIEVTDIAERPAYFVTAKISEKYGWKANVIYETQLKNLKFTPSDECLEIRFFSAEEAAKENLYPIVKEFIKVYKPENRQKLRARRPKH